MIEHIDPSKLSVSVIDYLGEIENGVGILINIVAFDVSYEMAYWFNRQGNIKIVPEDKFLKLLGVKNIYDYDKIYELAYFIHNSLPDTSKILDEFLNKE